MRKEAEDSDSPKRSIRDSGYIDCWDSERSDSLSPPRPRHGREDSFDSLDSFGSRSRQTPSPDVLVARIGSSDGRGSDSESDFPHHLHQQRRALPDVRKDDMLARRTSVSEPRTALPFNQYLPNKSNQTAYVPTPLRRKQPPEREDGGRKSWSTATSPIGGERPFRSPSRSCSEELYRTSLTTSAMSTAIVVTVPLSPSPRDSPEPGRKFLPLKVDAGGAAGPSGKRAGGGAMSDDMWARRSQNSPKHSGGASPTHFLPVPATTANLGRALMESADSDKPRRRPSWLDDELSPTYSHSPSVSDDSESVSMNDVRSEDDVFLNPHSQVRHELMHNQYNKLKEEEDHWQDDLAKWKNRRRSVSQDLIKKEEERKMMEKLMTGDEGLAAQRRKSIKTYREIVEDKERRERELHEAYRGARTQEEANAILHRYAQRFSISEAILERLKLPKFIERSISADPTGSTSPAGSRLPPLPDFGDGDDVFEACFEPTDGSSNGGGGGSNGAGGRGATSGGSSPMKYLRQQSLPAPKFTSTVEAMVGNFAPPTSTAAKVPPPVPEKPSKPVPIIAPKPYAPQHRAREPAGDKQVKVDSMLRLNGEAVSNTEGKEGMMDEREDSPSPLQFLPCPVTEHEDQSPQQSSRASPVHVPVPVPSVSPISSSSPIHATQQQASPLQAHTPPKQESPSTPPPTHSPSQASPSSHTPQRGSPVTHTAEQASPAHTPPPPKQASPTHSSTHMSPSHTPPANTPTSEGLTPGSPTKSMVEEEEEEVKPTVEESQEKEKVSEAAPTQSQDASQSPESPKKSPPSRPTSLPSDLQSPVSPPLDDVEAESMSTSVTDTQPSQPTEVITSTIAPSVHTTAPTPVATEPGAVPGQESTAAQIGECTHLTPPLSRSPGAPPATESPAQEHSDVSEKYRREQEKLKQEWERAQREVEEEERKYHEEEQKILEETVAPLTPHSPAMPASPAPLRGDLVPTASPSPTPTPTPAPHDTIVRSLADWERKQEMLERQGRGSTDDWNQRDSEHTADEKSSHMQKAESADLLTTSGVSEVSSRSQHNGQRPARGHSQPRSPQPQSSQETTRNSKKTTSLDRKTGGRRSEDGESNAPNSPLSPPYSSSDTPPSSPNRSVSGKKLCSSCGHPLGKGAAMIIETLSLYFHIQCFKCGICKGQLGDTTTGTDVRIRNGLLNCHQCYIRSRSAGQPTTL